MGIMRKRNLFFGVIIVLSLAFFYIRYNIFVTSEEKIVSEFNKYQLYIAKDVSSDISDYFNDLYSADYKIVGIEGSANLRNKETLKRMLKYLSDYYVESIALYNSSGILIATSDSSYFKSSLDNSITNSRQLPGYFVSRKINDYKESTATNYFNLIAPAGRLNKNGVAQQRPAYWIDYRINSSKFFQYQIRKNGLLNSSQTIWIIDNNGYVIFQQDHPEMTHKNFYDMNNECLNCHSSNSYLTEIKNIPEGSFKYDLKNSKGKTASFTTLNLGSYKWKIVISTESGEVSHFIIFNGIKTFLLFTVFLTILILFSFYIVKLDHKQANYGIELKHLNEKNKLLQKIAQNEERYRQLVENSPDVIGIIQNGKIVFINKAGIEIINAKYESEILGKDYNSFLTLAGLADSAEKMKTIFSYSSPQVYEAVIRSIDGELISVEVISLSIMYKEKPAVQFMAKNITERKQAEEKINLLAQAIKSTGEGISITDLDNNILYVNDSFLSMFGYREEELIGRHISIVRSENNPEPFIEEVRISTIKRGWSGELINKKKDGTEFPIYLNTSSVIDEQGKPYALVGITRDITERKLFQESLQKSEAKYRKLFTEMKSAFALNEIVLNGEGKFIDFITVEVNGAFEKLLDLKRENVIGKKAGEILPPAEFDKLIKIFSPLAAEGRSINFKIFSLATQKHFEGNAYCPGPGKFAVFFSDATDKIKAENLLMESEERYRTLFDISPDSIYVHRNDRILYANSSGLRLLGAESFDQLADISVLSLVHPDNRQTVTGRINKVKFEGESLPRINEKFKRMDGTYVDVEVAAGPVVIDGQPASLVVARDITERKLAEEKLMAYRENLENLVNERTRELNITNLKLQQEIRKQKEFEMILKESLDKEKELNELKTRFISTTSHEFRTPLTSILSSAELIQRYESKWSREKINEHLNRIKYSVDYLAGLLDDILTISRTETGKIKYEPQTTDLYLLCEESIQHAKVHSSMMHKFIFNYGLKDRLFNLDSKLIKYILINLLSNAFKYSPGGGTVELGVSEEDSWLIFKIRDEGIGIPEADMKYLFEPFHRGANVKNIPGTGLGLSIVKKAVEFHLGKINCETTENGGTNFIITIPSGRKNDKEHTGN